MASRFRFSPRTPNLPSATVALLITFGICAVIGFISGPGGALWARLFGLNLPGGPPWGFLTYPLVVPPDPLFLLFQGLWLWSFGNMLERRLGTGPFLREFLTGTLLIGVSVAIAGLLAVGGAVLLSPFAPIAYITVVACAMMPDQEVLFWFVPLKMKWLALITAGFLLFNVSFGSPIVGIAGVLPLLFAWFYGLGRFGRFRPGADLLAAPRAKKRETREFDQFYGKVRQREQERIERERLRKLFEDSMDDRDN